MQRKVIVSRGGDGGFELEVFIRNINVTCIALNLTIRNNEKLIFPDPEVLDGHGILVQKRG